MTTLKKRNRGTPETQGIPHIHIDPGPVRIHSVIVVIRIRVATVANMLPTHNNMMNHHMFGPYVLWCQGLSLTFVFFVARVYPDM